MGHDEYAIKTVCRALNVSCLKYRDFIQTVQLISEDNLDKKSLYRQKTPIFPCVILYEAHACLAILQDKSKKKYYSYPQLEKAFMLVK